VPDRAQQRRAVPPLLPGDPARLARLLDPLVARVGVSQQGFNDLGWIAAGRSAGGS
jgi:hypothetical protein